MPEITVAFDWLNDGKATALKEIPLAGRRDLLERAKEETDLRAYLSTYRYFYLAAAIATAKKVLNKLGPERTKDLWDETIKARFGNDLDLIWPQAEFKENLEAFYERLISRQLAAVDEADADKKLKELGEKVEQQGRKFDENAIKRLIDDQLIELYWRLFATKVKSIKTPYGEVALDWNAAKKGDTINLLSQVVSEEDLGRLRPKPEGVPKDLKEYLPQDSEVVLGNSSPQSGPLTASRQDSTPSSEYLTEVTPT